jgi:signal transduction histidine kinase
VDAARLGSSGRAVVQVRDDGAGIAPHMLERIFERFVQAGAAGHGAEEGLGIGLALVKAIVELHGGSVEARSDGPGAGSEFTMRLPLVVPEAGAA